MRGLASWCRKVQTFGTKPHRATAQAVTAGRDRPIKGGSIVYRVTYRLTPAYSPHRQHVYERYVDDGGLRELIDWIDDNDDVELLSIKQLREED